jgi:hypothetical protein
MKFYNQLIIIMYFTCENEINFIIVDYMFSILWLIIRDITLEILK